MKTVIIGANGVIGNRLFRDLSARYGGCVGLTTKKNPELTTVNYDLNSLRSHISNTDVVIYCAGVTKFADCEQFPESSFLLNTQLPQKILHALSSKQIFVYFSSPVAVHGFDNSNISKYALHKRQAERGLQASNVIIVRPSKVIESVTLLSEWKDKLQKKQNIAAFTDQFVSPIDKTLLSNQLLHLLESGCRGAYNFSARDRISYRDLARTLCSQLGFDHVFIEEKSARIDNPFFIDQDVLDCTAAQKAIGYTPPASQDIVSGYLKSLS